MSMHPNALLQKRWQMSWETHNCEIQLPKNNSYALQCIYFSFFMFDIFFVFMFWHLFFCKHWLPVTTQAPIWSQESAKFRYIPFSCLWVVSGLILRGSKAEKNCKNFECVRAKAWDCPRNFGGLEWPKPPCLWGTSATSSSIITFIWPGPFHIKLSSILSNFEPNFTPRKNT